MADNKPTEKPAPDEAAPAVRAKGSSLMRINILLFLITIVLGECLAAAFFLPSESEAAAAAQTGKPEPAVKVEEPKVEESKAVEQIEVDLGEFTVTSFQPAANSTLRIDFHLYATVNAESEKGFSTLLEENKHRFREQVLTIVRSAELADLTDASLSLVKRKIHDKANHMLGKPLLESVIISDFSFIEQ